MNFECECFDAVTKHLTMHLPLPFCCWCSLSGWCADASDDNEQWFQVDFNNTFTITFLHMAGFEDDEYMYVKTFALKYSYDGTTWHNYTNGGKELVRVLLYLFKSLLVA
jgi:hypothetical protein